MEILAAQCRKMQKTFRNSMRNLASVFFALKTIQKTLKFQNFTPSIVITINMSRYLIKSSATYLNLASLTSCLKTIGLALNDAQFLLPLRIES
ncbi:hypothetical protein FGO68_gene11930 [Halteria grandinella]|uniref:Uncharacterized protein n=1 Tax=Halteria grandinella TaxID=5974 RepID=A0A8J8NSM6_HALGN|nr:hypothetical protein FGO68_gene11930 [Halteria grandinella]